MENERKTKFLRLVTLLLPPILFLGIGYSILTIEDGGSSDNITYDLLFAGAQADLRLNAGLYEKYGTLLSEEQQKDPWGKRYREDVYADDKFVLWSAGPDTTFTFEKGSDDILIFHLELLNLDDPQKIIYETMVERRYPELGKLLLNIEDGDFIKQTKHWLKMYNDSLSRSSGGDTLSEQAGVYGLFE